MSRTYLGLIRVQEVKVLGIEPVTISCLVVLWDRHADQVTWLLWLACLRVTEALAQPQGTLFATVLVST